MDRFEYLNDRPLMDAWLISNKVLVIRNSDGGATTIPNTEYTADDETQKKQLFQMEAAFIKMAPIPNYGR